MPQKTPRGAPLAPGGAPGADARRPERGGDGLAGQRRRSRAPSKRDREGGPGPARRPGRAGCGASLTPPRLAGSGNGRGGTARGRGRAASPSARWAIRCPVPGPGRCPRPRARRRGSSPGTRGSGPIAGQVVGQVRTEAAVGPHAPGRPPGTGKSADGLGGEAPQRPGARSVRSKPTRSRLAPISTGPAAVPSTTAEVSRAAESLATSAT